ncbi:Ketimine reductase mu-crystallin [Hondaea fermentalgiana]|uniref:Ketimine reductase mu-crystallin n=1 Tax=Hondaea fermentalgiana TaxID=2315210 RepID=A0A2R5G7D3_9STRA|nr:Ketimine reductase mu-crystallin [Hondaea fermentalgiana]|eukprot:GBG26962.1 Ketimine reductase mu-crystallin [Hondaea fermentalgiana]
MLVLSDNVVREHAVTWRIIAANERAFAALHAGTAIVPPRIVLEFANTEGASLFKPGAFEDEAVFGQKVINVRPGNAARGMGTTPAVTMLFDKASGAPVCLLNATYLTALRTAAGSAVATARVAPQDVRCLVIFGAGLQAEAHATTMCCVRDFDKVVIINRDQNRADALSAQLRERLVSMPRGPDAQTLGDNVPQISTISSEDTLAVEAACRRANVICTTTGSPVPLFRGEWLQPGTHVNAVGSYLPANAELDVTTISRCERLIVDTDEAWDAGDLLNALSEGAVKKDLAVSLGALIASGVTPPATHAADSGLGPKGISVFKSVGSAIQDIASALQVYADIKAMQASATGSAVSIAIQEVQL